MTVPEPTRKPAPSAIDWAVRIVFFTLMALAMIALPHTPSFDLDASWRMALGKFFLDGLQFGKDVVFTYGPLGFLMGKTYCGYQYHSLILWQVVQAVIFTLLIFRQGFRLEGYTRYAYFAFFFLLGIYYEDGLHQLIIGIAGFELLRNGEQRRTTSTLLALLLSFLGLLKFTNLLMGAVFVACTLALLLWRRRPSPALWLAGWFAGSYLLGWILCRQNPLNLPAYFYNSWEISQGYQEAMGIPTPPVALYVGLATVVLVLIHAALYLLGLPDRPRALATLVSFAAFILLNWKHGFVRADGHMIGYFFVILMVATAYPALLDDVPRFRRAQQCILFLLAAGALLGIGITLPGLLRGILSGTQDRLFTNVAQLSDPAALRTYYQEHLASEQAYYDMPMTRKVVGMATLDVLGYEQAIALYNRFNYHPRPVLQSYSSYRPHLSHLNYQFYASRKAPEYVLVKLHTIDRRLVACDDAEVLSLLVHRYEFVHLEKGFQLWHRKPGPFSAESIAPRPLRTATLQVGQPFEAEEFNGQPLWVNIDVRPSLLGRLRGFLYKLPIIILRIENTQKMITEYRLPLPLGQTGFIINPVVEDIISYMQFAGGQPDRLLRSLKIEIADADRPYFSDFYTVTLSALPPSTAGREYFRQAEKRLFQMFDVTPTTYQAKTTPSEGEIDGRKVMVFHAPSEMTFNIPRGATECSGAFGFLEGAYTGGNETDGAVFYITWVLGTEEILLMERPLDPLHKLGDRGLQYFKVPLPARDGGYLRLTVSPGPKNSFAWDWTAWSGISIH
jgi:hypothetical protein